MIVNGENLVMIDKVFKIKVNRREDAVQILEQPDDLPDGYILTYNGIKIRRAYFPEYSATYPGTLFLRGKDWRKDMTKIKCNGDMTYIITAIQYLCEDRMYKFVKVGDGFMGEIE